jgi:hypothetical protein
MDPVKNFPKYMVDNGLIFEINRRILHPLGLSLIVDVDRNNKQKLTISNLISTEDKEGFLYDEEGYNIGAEKYARFIAKKDISNKLKTRKDILGFIEQSESK